MKKKKFAPPPQCRTRREAAAVAETRQGRLDTLSAPIEITIELSDELPRTDPASSLAVFSP